MGRGTPRPASRSQPSGRTRTPGRRQPSSRSGYAAAREVRPAPSARTIRSAPSTSTGHLPPRLRSFSGGSASSRAAQEGLAPSGPERQQEDARRAYKRYEASSHSTASRASSREQEADTGQCPAERSKRHVERL